MTIRGRLKRVFFGGEAWVVETDEGVTWQLSGDVPTHLDGQSVVIEGQPGEQQFGITMSGPIFEAASIKAE